MGETVTTGQIIIALASTFTWALLGYKRVADQRGWPSGTVYASGGLAAKLGMTCIAVIFGRIGYAFISNDGGIWATAAFLVGITFGTGIAFAVMRSAIGPLALFAAPACCILLIFS
jgi:hypothetical protein